MRILASLPCSALLSCLIGACATPAGGGSESTDSTLASLLFVQSAEAYSYDSDTRTMTFVGVSPVVTFFSDRPQRIAGHVRLEGFLQLWDEGTDSLEADPPNANLSVVDEGNVNSTVIELRNPVMDGDSLTYEVSILEGDLPPFGGVNSLFIDDLLLARPPRRPLVSGGARGAALGAIGGAIAGDAGKGAAIGAAVGASGSLLKGRRQQKAAAEQASTHVVNVPNANGSFTPVTLHLGPNGWVGPKGEVYPTLPTPDQLKGLYGVR